VAVDNGVPSFEWYSAKSKADRLSPRCPIAHADLCPRYYASLWLLGKAGLTTNISDADGARLDKKWQIFKPAIAEEEPSINSTNDGFRSIGNFCPEIAYDFFGAFTASLSVIGDEIDRGVTHEALARAKVPASDPRWRWALGRGKHYTECREYSIFKELSAKPSKSMLIRRGLTPKLRWAVFARDSFTCSYCGRRAPEVALEVDHKTSVADGGTDEMDNLISACIDCNRGKGPASLTRKA
jgi:hypothetical protein